MNAFWNLSLFGRRRQNSVRSWGAMLPRRFRFNPRPNRFGRVCAAFALVAAAMLVGACCHQPARAKFQPFDFVQMCDPQIGFTEYAADLGRFEQAITMINGFRPDFVVICGDLVNAANLKSFGDFNAARARFAVPCYVAPGNHDIGNKPTAATLERYRRFEGKDYFSFEHKGCLFVVANSQLWKTPVPGETEKHDSWLEKTLAAAARRQKPVFVVMHYPLFVKEAREPDDYFNLPLEKRQELLGLFRRSGVVAVLAGHTHTTAILEEGGIQMVTSENTSRNFDKKPYGFRVWHVGKERPYQHQFVPLPGQ